MKVPWRFLIGLLLGLVLGISVFIAFLYTQLGVPTRMSQWISDISQKKERLAAEVKGPRLLIVAGSSALFGINAKMIEEQTGCPTINFGTHAGLSLDYRLYRIKKVARPGDTVLLACEYEFYDNGFAIYAEINDDYVLSRDTEYFHKMPLSGKIDMATRIAFKRLQRGWKNSRTPDIEPPTPGLTHSVYSPITPGIDCLDDNGDEVFNLEAWRLPPKVESMEHLIPDLVNGLPSESTDGFKVLSSFLQWAQANHVKVLATFPAVIYHPIYDQPNGQKTIEMITHFYSSHGVPVIGTAKEAMLPENDFFDTFYHLTYEEALKRTERLIPELKPYLPAPH